MNYWDIVLFVLSIFGVIALFALYMWGIAEAFYRDRKVLGWSMVGALVALFVFGFPLLVVGTGGVA